MKFLLLLSALAHTQKQIASFFQRVVVALVLLRSFATLFATVDLHSSKTFFLFFRSIFTLKKVGPKQRHIVTGWSNLVGGDPKVDWSLRRSWGPKGTIFSPSVLHKSPILTLGSTVPIYRFLLHTKLY